MVAVIAGIPGRQAGLGMLGRREEGKREGEAEESGEKGPEEGTAELAEPYVPKLDGP